MIPRETLEIAQRTAESLRRRGEDEPARAIETLVEAARGDAVPSLSLLTSTEAGDILGVSAQTIKNWVKEGRLRGYRVGGRIMVPKDAMEEYVRQARLSLDLEVLPDDAAAELTLQGRQTA